MEPNGRSLGHWGVSSFHFLTGTVAFLIAGTKLPDRKSLREEGSIAVGKAWQSSWQRLVLVAANRKQRKQVRARNLRNLTTAFKVTP